MVPACDSLSIGWVWLWLGGDKMFLWLPKAIVKYYGRKTHQLVSTEKQKLLRLLLLVSHHGSSPRIFRAFLYTPSADVWQHCVRPQIHINHHDNSHVSYCGFKARSYAVKIILDFFWFSVSGQKGWKKKGRYMHVGFLNVTITCSRTAWQTK